MAITIYSELQTSVKNWLKRNDLTAVIPDFITLAEAKLKRDLRVSGLEKIDTLSVSSELTNLPTDYLEMRSVYVDTDPRTPLSFMSPRDMNSRYLGTSSGVPIVYSIVGSQIKLGPVPSAAMNLKLDYYAFPVLSATNTTNWLLTNHPDIYLYATLLEAEPYLKNDKRVLLWAEMLKSAIAQLNEADDGYRFGGDLRIRVDA